MIFQQEQKRHMITTLLQEFKDKKGPEKYLRVAGLELTALRSASYTSDSSVLHCSSILSALVK